MPTVEFVPDKAAIKRFRSWQGTLGRTFGRLERETVWRQKLAANVRTGNLRSSITSKRRKYAGGNLGFDAGSWTVSYAAVHELGSKPHVIEAKNAPYLAFYWPKVGSFVAFKSVSHPGTRPYRFASLGMERAMKMWQRGG